jgi:hypothetical protein
MDVVRYRERQLKAEQQLQQLSQKGLQLLRDRQLHEQDYVNNEVAEVRVHGAGRWVEWSRGRLVSLLGLAPVPASWGSA